MSQSPLTRFNLLPTPLPGCQSPTPLPGCQSSKILFIILESLVAEYVYTEDW